MAVDLLGNQGKIPLRVGLALDKLSVGPKLLVETRDLAETSVVSHNPTPCRERMSVRSGSAARSGQAYVRHEGRRSGLLRLPDELLVAERGLGLLVENGPPRTVKESNPAAIRVAPALHLQGVRRVKQPKGRGDAPGSSGHSE